MSAVCLSNSGLYLTGYGLRLAGTFRIVRELLRHGYILGLLGLGLWFERDHFPAVLRADKEGLLLSGEICHLQSSPLDKSAYPLFGDAGTVTALEYQEGYEPVRFHFSDGWKRV